MKSRRLPARLDPYYRRLLGFRQHFWEAAPEDMKGWVGRGATYTIRFIYILLKEIQNNQLWQRAAALTYTTILSLFPLLIILTSLGSVFYSHEEEEKVIEFIESRLLPPTNADILNIAEQEALSDREQQIQGFVQNIRQMSASYRESAPGVGIFGLVAFLIAAFFLYNSIEQAFEASWETGRKRTFARTVSGFTILVVFAPLIFGVSITASSFLVQILGREEAEAVTAEDVAADAARETARQAEIKKIEDQWEEHREAVEERAKELQEGDPETAEPIPPAPSTTVPASQNLSPNGEFIEAVRRLDVLKIMLGLVTPLFNSIMLALAFMLIPQRRVRLPYALIGGLTAGILWEVAKVGFFYYVYLSTMRRQLLQSLGAVPIFLIWIYFTWLVFLVGNELTFVSQNLRKLLNLYFGRRNSTLFDGQVFVGCTLLVADAFERGERGMRQPELAQKMQLTFREFDIILNLLRQVGALELTEDNRVTLARPASKIAVHELLELGCDPTELCDYYELSRRPQVERGLKVLNGRILAAGQDLTLDQLLEAKDSEGVTGTA